MQYTNRSHTPYAIDNLSTINGGLFMLVCLLDTKSLLAAYSANVKGSEWQRRPRGQPRACVVPGGTA